MIFDLIKKNRSYRRFDNSVKIKTDELRAMVDSARLSGSAANLQRLRYILINDKETTDKIFPTLAFAGYLKDWKGPSEDERPVAYIIICTEKEADVNVGIDIGIAAQSILLTAAEMSYGGCMIRSFSSDLADILGRQGYIPALVIALGYPAEKVYLVEAKNKDIKYYRDENDAHAVPKLSLDEIII